MKSRDKKSEEASVEVGVQAGNGLDDPSLLAEGTLKSRAIRGSLWTIGGSGAGQVIRLGANLVLTRLLYPEAFGIMALVNVFLQGIIMLSDVGIRQAVIRDQRGDEREFLDTAWTLSVVRGLVLFAIALPVSWALSTMYEEPRLMQFMPVASLVLILNGSQSTAVMSYRRHLSVRKLALLDLSAQIASVIVMIGWALLSPSIWALVAGGVAGGVFRLILSFTYLGGARPRFRWEKPAARAILSFGIWIFFSSALTFVAGQLDRILLGYLLGMATLGVYGIAVNLALMVEFVVVRLTGAVVYPAFSEIARRDRHRLRSVYYRVRLGLDLLVLPAVGVLLVIGPQLVRFLFDSRYHEAGWMFRFLLVRAAFVTVLKPCSSCLTALGQPQFAFYRNLCRAVWMVVMIPLGWHLMGVTGLCAAVALSEVPSLVLLWTAFYRRGLLDLRREMLAFGLVGGGFLLGSGGLWAVSALVSHVL